jgi:outer membrane protein assembly factor BamB
MGLQQIYVTAEDGAVVAFDAETGRINWRQDQLLRRGVSAPLVVDPGVVVVDAEGWLHLLNRADGGFRARTKGEGEIVAAPVDIGPGFVVQTRKGELDAYKLN